MRGKVARARPHSQRGCVDQRDETLERQEILEREETLEGEEMLEGEETLGEFLADRARRLSDTRIAGDAILAVIVAVGIAVWRGPLWDVRIAAAGCVLAFALWGAADRELLARELMAARVVRWVAGLLGFGAGAYALIALVGRAIGRVIS